MHILVRTITGKTCDISLDNTNQVCDINSEIERIMGIPSDYQTLLYNKQKLSASNILSECFSTDEISLHLLVNLEGGAKGKKKKKVVKKNKKPHKHRKHKLAVLSYYKLEGEGVVRVRQQCKLCPAGIIENKNRYLLS